MKHQEETLGSIVLFAVCVVAGCWVILMVQRADVVLEWVFGMFR
jgi:uncharacterized membrane-anchored protein